MDINNVKADYSCLYCQNIYVEPKKLIKCGHSMCSKCLKDYTVNQQKLNCPTCNTPFQITDIIPDENLNKRMMDIKIKCECNQIMTLFQYSSHCNICAVISNKFKNEEKNKDKKIEINLDKIKSFKQTFDCTLCEAKNFDRADYIKHISNKHRNEKGICSICKNQPCEEHYSINNIYEHINNRHIFETGDDYNNNEQLGKSMIVSKETFNCIINNDKEKRLYDFEKNFLIKYLKSNFDFGALFEKKVGKYFQSLIEQPRKQITFLVSDKNPIKIELQIARIDLASCLLDYLEDKFIVLNDSTDLKQIESRILSLQELKKYQSDMLMELNKIMELIEEKESKNFLILNICINENVANFIFSSRLFLESELKRKSKKVKIKTNTNKRDNNKITYDFLDSNGAVVFSTKVNKKIFGAQFGGIISIESKQNKARKFFKTHQDGSRFTNFSGVLYNSRSISLAKPVNIRELFIYKVLEKLGMGPEVTFVVNPFVRQDLYIVTKDLNNTNLNEIFITAVNIVNKEKIEKLISDKNVIIEFTKFDLINRILGINDLNSSNYGILSKGDKKFVKIIDFRAPNTFITLSDISLKNYLKANGGLYKKEDLAKKILSNREPKQKFSEGFEALKSIGNENFKGILIPLKDDILNFISQIDDVSNLEIKQQIGLDDEVIDDLNDYIITIQKNFEFAMNYFVKNSNF